MKPSASLLLVAALVLCVACGSSHQNTLPPGQSFVYVANQGSQTISAFKRDPSSGALTAVPGSPFPASVRYGMWSSPIEVDPQNLLLFALGGKTTSGGQLSVFVIDPDTGALSPASGSPFSFPACSTRSLSVDPQGRFVYVGTQCAGILAWAIDRANLTLVPVSGMPFGDPYRAYAASVDVVGKYLYAADTNEVVTFAIDPNSGALQLANGPFRIPYDFPMFILPHPNGQVAYVIGDGNDLSLELWTCALVPSNGALSAVEREPGGVPLLVLTPDGKFLFSMYETYSIMEPSGFLQRISPNPLKFPLPRGAAVSPDSRFVYAAGDVQLQTDPGSLSVFSLDGTTGSTSEIPDSPYAVGATPVGVAITH